MPEQWQLTQAARLIKICKFLTARADQKGMTHGEKHFLHETIGMLLLEALDCLGEQESVMERNLSREAPSEIPF